MNERGTEARSRYSHFCRRKEMSIKHYEYMSVFLPYLSATQSSCTVLYCHLWPVWLYHTFPLYLLNDMTFEICF
jgi:hypothetical protein